MSKKKITPPIYTSDEQKAIAKAASDLERSGVIEIIGPPAMLDDLKKAVFTNIAQRLTPCARKGFAALAARASKK